MNITRFVRDIVASPYYRSRPVESIRLGWAKLVYARHRTNDPLELLRHLGITPEEALSGFDRWAPILRQVQHEVTQAEGQHGGISFEDGTILYGITRALEPEYIVETGVAAGVSTSFFGAALLENGHGRLYSIELPPAAASVLQSDGVEFEWPSRGVGWAIPSSISTLLANRHTLILDDVRDALPKLVAKLPHLDLFFHDDMHLPHHMLWEYDLVWPRLRRGGVIVSDDVDFGWIAFIRKHHLGRGAYLNVQRLAATRRRTEPEVRMASVNSVAGKGSE